MLEYSFSMHTKNAGSVKSEWNQLIISSQKPLALNFSSSILWLIVSNTFLRSISITPVKRPLSKTFQILLFKYERHKSVEYFLLKPDWYFYKMSLLGSVVNHLVIQNFLKDLWNIDLFRYYYRPSNKISL